MKIKYLYWIILVSGIINAQTNYWISKAPMNSARTSLGPHAGVVGDKIYIVGGFDGSSPLSSIERYDPISNTWTTVANMDSSICQYDLSVVNNKIYIISGTPDFSRLTNRVLVYDPSLNIFSFKTDIPTARKNHSTSVLNGKIYVIGGINEKENEFHNTVEMYDPDTDSWERKANLNIARAFHSSSSFNGKIFVFGGFNGNLLSTIEVFDPSSNNWSLLSTSIGYGMLHIMLKLERYFSNS